MMQNFMLLLGQGCKEDTATKPSDVYELLTKKWNLKEPKLVVSVVGDVDDDVPGKLRQAFRDSIETLLKTPDTWLLTDGRNTGLAEYVGKAVERLDPKEKESAVVIGVAHDDDKRSNKTKNLDTECKEPGPGSSTDTSKYGNKEEEPDLNKCHRIRIDDANYKQSNAAAEFTAAFQSYISSSSMSKEENAPAPKAAVSLIFGGNPRNMGPFQAIIEKHLPMVTIKGSGGAADYISKLCGSSCNVVSDDGNGFESSDDDVKESTRESRKLSRDDDHLQTSGESVDEDFKTKIRKNKKMVQVCVLDRDSNGNEAEGLNAAILRAVIYWSNNTQNADVVQKLCDQIDLSLSLNESQTARNHIFERIRKMVKSDEKINLTTEKNHMKKLKRALVNDLPDFVELFLEAKYKYCNLHEFDEGDVEEIYGSMLESKAKTDESIVSLLNKLIEKDRKGYKKKSEDNTTELTQNQEAGSECKTNSKQKFEGLPLIGRIISELVGPHFELAGKYGKGDQSKDENTISEEERRKQQKKEKIDVATHLFLWAVLFNREGMAYFFWKHGNSDQKSVWKHPHIIMALMASTILSKLAEEAHDRKEPDLQESLAKHAKLFEERACEVLKECSTNDRHKTQDILTREHSRTIWGKRVTLLSAAYNGERRHFLELMPCRVKLDGVWRGKMVWSTPWLKVFLTAICPILIAIIKFTDNQAPADVFGMMMMGSPPSSVGVDAGDKKNETGSRSKKIYTVGTKKSDTTVHWFSAILYLYTAPITKYYCCTFSYLVFLVIFSGTCLTNLNPGSPSVPEVVVWVWILLFLIEEIRQIIGSSAGSDTHKRRYTGDTFVKDVKIWLQDKWNRFDLFLYFVMSLICLILRLVLPEPDFQHARNAFAITLACFFFRFLQTFYAFVEVGSKVLIIFHMMKDLFKFGLILFVFILSYGVASTVILYPNRTLSWDLARYLIYSPYWQIFVRDAFVDRVDGEDGVPTCSGNLTSSLNGNNGPQCHVDNRFGDVLLVVYTMFTNVLLLNVLIAMFNSTFERFHKDSTTWWHFNRYSLVYEYVYRPGLAPPLIIFSYLHRLARWMNRRCACGCDCYTERSALCTKVNDPLDVDSVDDDRTDFERINMEKRMEHLDRQNEVKNFFKENGILPKQAAQIGDPATADDDEDEIVQTGLIQTMFLAKIISENISKQLTTKLGQRNKPAQITTDRLDYIDERLDEIMATLKCLKGNSVPEKTGLQSRKSLK